MCASVCTQCAVSLAAPPRTARQCYCSCDRPSSSSSSPDSHFRCFPASALLLYFLLSSSSSSPPLPVLPLLFFFFFPDLVFSDCLPLFYPHSLNSRQQENDWQSHLARRATDPLINPPLPLVVATTTVRLSGLTYFLRAKPNSNLRVCFVGMTLSTCMGVCAYMVTFVSKVCFLWINSSRLN